MLRVTISRCPVCTGIAEMQTDLSIFAGSDFGDRYPPKVTKQRHGYRILCLKCGLQTCWWHYQSEAADAWNQRPWNLRHFQKEVRDWAADTFPGQTKLSIVEHLRREVEELAQSHTGEEVADCFLLLLDYAEFCGFDVQSEGISKFEICKNREWGQPDSASVIEHIEPDAGANEDPEGES